MALLSVNAPRSQPQKESTLDKILKGVQLAQSVLGSGLQVAGFKREGEAQEAAQELAGRKQTFAELKDFEGVEAGPPSLVPEKLPEGVQGPPSLIPKAAPTPEGAVPTPEGSAFTTPFIKPRDDLSRIIKESKVAGLQPLSSNIELQNIVRNAPGGKDLADAPGVTLSMGRDFLVSQGKKDPAVQLLLKKFDFEIAKDKKRSFNQNFGETKKEVNEIRAAARKESDQLAKIQEQIRSGGEIGINVAATTIAKSVGSDAGALSDKDVARYLPNSLPGTISRITNFLTGDKEVSLTVEEVAAMRRAVVTAALASRARTAFNISQEIELMDDDLKDSPKVKIWMNKLERQFGSFEVAGEIDEIQKELERMDANDPDLPELRRALVLSLKGFR